MVGKLQTNKVKFAVQIFDYIHSVDSEKLARKIADEQYKIIEGCSWGPYLELFARGKRKNWTVWGNESKFYSINWKTYKNNSSVK